MKKLLLLVAFLSAGLVYQSASAQVSISANINIGRPIWAPVDYVYADNYYFPEYDMYYDVRARQYHYLDRGRWVCAPSIPVFYRNVDFVRARKVVIHERNPYMRNDYWRSRYGNRRDFGRPDYRDNRRDDRGRDNNWDRRDNNRGNDYGHDNGRHSEHRGRH